MYENQRLEPKNSEKDEKNGNTEPIPPVWTPKSSGRATPSDQITFKPVKFQSPVPARKASKVNKVMRVFDLNLNLVSDFISSDIHLLLNLSNIIFITLRSPLNRQLRGLAITYY